MSELPGLPSLLVFGPQTELPSEETWSDLRQELVGNPHLSALRDAVADLPHFWHRLVASDPALRSVPGAHHLAQLVRCVSGGGSSFLHPQGESDAVAPSHYTLAVTVLCQISQYTRYLGHLGGGRGVGGGEEGKAHRRVLDAVRGGGGIQGFCVGLLSAVAVAGAQDEAGLGAAAAVALRLAVCVGAYVDHDGVFAPEPSQTQCVAVRWRDGSGEERAELEKTVRSFPQAYISSITDKACVTVTLRHVDVDGFLFKVRGLGLRAKSVPVHGRFHSDGHAKAVDKLVELVRRERELQFPGGKELRAPVRSTVDGGLLALEYQLQLTRIVLESLLLKPANWYATLRASVEQLATSMSNKTIIFAGFGNHIPASLVQGSSLQVFPLRNLKGANAKPNGINVINGVYDTQAIPVTATDDLSQYPSHSIAIVGLAGRFPGADSVDELWDLLLARKSMVEPAPVERLHLPHTGDYANTKWWGNFLRDPDAFDHRFFKKSSREALIWDPQQRILLEVVYEALESAGYFGIAAAAQPDDYGCYIGAVMSSYYDNVSCHPPTAYATLGTSRCFVSGSMSHYFGWTGPSLTIDTACSSSLVAINTACRAIWSGECTRAVAGGTNVISSPLDYLNLAAAGFLNTTGQCKPFDAAADGYCRGEGVGVVVLKRLRDALRDGDAVHGVIVGSAVNQNHNASHITVPQPESQVALYQKVLRQGGVEPEAVSYVEAHGTGTSVGDPVEVSGIRGAFGGPQREDRLHFGSVKGNIGHTESTAGVAGLIKVLLMMRHGRIPPQASHTAPNPKLGSLADDKMAIPTSVLDWRGQDGAGRVAFVNSYGAAGSNSAVLVRERPSFLAAAASAPVQLAKYPVVFSANSTNSLRMYSQKLLSWLKNPATTSTITDPAALLSSLAFHLANRANHALPFRLVTTATSLGDLETKLEAAAAGSESQIISPPAQGKSKAKPTVAVLVFGGQESDFIGISEDVYHSSKVFRHHLDVCQNLLVAEGRAGLFPLLFQREPVRDLVALHAGLFAVQYASAKAWLDCGLQVGAVVGHSFGQLTAICISGVLSLADTLKLVTGRAEIIEKYWGPEPGSMLCMQADRGTVDQALHMLSGKRSDRKNACYAEVACYNGPKNQVVVGSAQAIDLLEQQGSASSIRTKRLNVTHGFHSKFTEPMLEPLAALAQGLEWRRPSIHLETCDELESQTEPGFGIAADLTRRPVYFQHAVERLAARFSESTCAWVEAGRGSSVIQLVRGCVAESQSRSQSQSQSFVLSPQLTLADAQASLTDTTVELWKSGLAVQYWAFHRSQRTEFGYLSLPPYQFEKTRHWLPFTGRWPEKPDEQHKEEQEASPETHELLTFLHYNTDVGGDTSRKGKQQAVFRIDPYSDRFQSLWRRARPLWLQDDVAAATYVPTVADLVMMSPIGQSTAKTITLKLTRRDGNEDGQGEAEAWSFSIATQDVSSAATPSETSSTVVQGTVRLRKRTDAHTARAFQRFEALTGHGRRMDELLAHPDAETMRGPHIYRAFDTVVHYEPAYQGIKDMACVGHEATGTVRVMPDPGDPADQRLCDTPMMDSLLQLAGFLVSYFHNASPEQASICFKIEHIEMGGSFDPDAGEWRVFATMADGGGLTGGGEGGQHADATADAYVFDARTGKMVMAAFGFHFSRMPRTTLAGFLGSVSTSKTAVRTSSPPVAMLPEQQMNGPVAAVVDAPAPKTSSKGPSKRPELLQILANVTDLPLSELTGEASLEDLGVDSLMATEVLNDIRTGLGLTIDLTSFLFFPNLNALAVHVDEQLGLSGGSGAAMDGDGGVNGSSGPSAPSLGNSGITNHINGPGTTSTLPTKPTAEVEVEAARPTITNALEAFRETRLNYDRLAKSEQGLDYFADAFPHHKRLNLAYTVEAFARMGCDLKTLPAGRAVPQVQGTLARHAQLMQRLYRVLEDGRLIQPAPASPSGPGASFTRTSTPLDPVSAEAIYQEIVDLYPQHVTIPKLVRAVGSELALCLTGAKDALQILFGDRANKKLLEDMYEFLPLLRTPALVLGDFLTQALTRASGGGRFRILEVGAGTGGTTRHLVSVLRRLGIPFEYTFTDLAGSLVGAAKRQFRDLAADGTMLFRVLDVEQPPRPEDVAAYHVVLATNCIHATRVLRTSLTHVRRMLRDDGVLALIEITQNMLWPDLVVGLLEGWWLFEDGRTHALVDETHWEREMKAAGFAAVEWSDGDSPESKAVNGALDKQLDDSATKEPANTKTVLETVVYKTIGDQDIHADVYWPVPDSTTSSSGSPSKPKPIALMIHGGSHIIFSRKDIRPAQTRLLLARGFVPVSLDHRLCPEVPLAEGAMADVCSALAWARETLPGLDTPQRPRGLQVDGTRVVVVGWSSGGQLAMSLCWTAPARGLAPPTAVLAFYCPTDYEDGWWRAPIHPIGTEDPGPRYDVLEAVQDAPVTNYGAVGAWEPLEDPRIMTDPRCRIVLHINWRAQTLPVIVDGLPSRRRADADATGIDWNVAPQPALERVRAVSPRAHIADGTYGRVPTFLVHGTADDLIPWQQSRDTYDALASRGVPSGLALVEGAPHICDLSSDPESEGWKATMRGYDFICSYVM
ncbi:Methylphloroacetophenone synthase [Apiospora kogelbergensis]|uniref:Methylphloroacetophenone synthase n=1 Tax=Apiospora kogelbergensis TaxID=1337665 RepID=UPI00312FCD18